MPKGIRAGFSANSLSQKFELLYESAGLQGASSHSGVRSFLTTLAGHRSIISTAAYLYSSPSPLKAAIELV
jgi:integrase/recombinase XerD